MDLYIGFMRYKKKRNCWKLRKKAAIVTIFRAPWTKQHIVIRLKTYTYNLSIKQSENYTTGFAFLILFWHGRSREQPFVTVYEARKIYTFQNISCTWNGKGLVWTFTYNLSIGRSEYGTMKIGFFYLKRFFNLLFDTAKVASNFLSLFTKRGKFILFKIFHAPGTEKV